MTKETVAIENIIEFGDCRTIMDQWIHDGVKVQMCITSPPYFGLRDYNVEGQIGLETSPEDYVSTLVDVFRRVRDLLKDDGLFFLNLGDTYAGSGRAGKKGIQKWGGIEKNTSGCRWGASIGIPAGLKRKDLIGIPWRTALALQADGWYLRQDIIWNKVNVKPLSVKDRCTTNHEYVFMLSKKPRYYYDYEAVKEPAVTKPPKNIERKTPPKGTPSWMDKETLKRDTPKDGKRNKRSVWTIPNRPFKGAHFATFPPELVEPPILAGSRPGDIVLDPFMGSGTVAGVALKHGRKYLGCDLNPEYKQLQDDRIRKIFES